MQSLQPAEAVSLRGLFPHARIYGGRDIRISTCCADPYGCRQGDLFVAVQSPDFDGHDFVQEAVRRGAKAILAERQLPVDAPICIVPDTREAYGRLCQTLAGNPSQQLRTIGVSGTNGKTTTALLIASVLRAAKQRTGVLTTIAYNDGLECAPADRTTPEASGLAYWMSRMRAAGCVNAVLEVSSHALAQKRIAGVGLDAAVLTNVRRDHLDFHGNIFNYRRAKARLFQHLKPQGFAVVNADDPASKFVLGRLECPVLTVGMRTPAELTANVVECHACEQTFLLNAGNETAAVQTRMFGDHHVYNCLAAAAVGLVLGLDLTTVARGLESLDRVPGRL
jgi:UDP-N-acetylmuramoyl-L-alanyl-D-glutamate--2,6-diaminopimelate ligase